MSHYRHVIALPVDENDSVLLDVKSALQNHGVAGKWKEIGLFFGLAFHQLERMQGESDMVEAWLKQSYDTEHFGKPSWKKLVSAVGSRAGAGDVEAAKRIASRHRVESNSTPC